MDWSLAYFGLGLFTGFSAGLLGIGGGLVMIPTSMLMAPLGAKLTDRLPILTLKRIFAGLLVALAAKMLWKLLS